MNRFARVGLIGWLLAALLAASGVAPSELVVAADAVLNAHAARSVPAAVLGTLQSAHDAALAGLERVSESAREVDTSLPQMVDSARGKIDFQYQRLREGLVGKVQKKLERQHPEWTRLRYFLMPGEKWQERRLATLELLAWRGSGVGAEVTELAREHARRLTEGVHEHLVAEL